MAAQKRSVSWFVPSYFSRSHYAMFFKNIWPTFSGHVACDRKSDICLEAKHPTSFPCRPRFTAQLNIREKAHPFQGNFLKFLLAYLFRVQNVRGRAQFARHSISRSNPKLYKSKLQ